MPKEVKQEKQLNCGLDALSKIGALKNVSAFTLVHLARDNGMNIQVFKVPEEDFMKVVRPAIFHQEDHFVYIKNGEPMPEGKYTGFVLGSVILGRVVSLAEAKFIKGGKNFLTGENKDGVKEGGGALGTILGVVGAVVGTLILPGIGSALGYTTATGGAALSGAAAGAIGGALGGGIGAGVTGDNAILGAGLGALGGVGIGGGITAASAGGGGLAAHIGNFTQGTFNTLAHPVASLGAGGNAIATSGISGLGASGVASGINPGLLSQSANSAIAGVPAGYGSLAGGAGSAASGLSATGTGASFAANAIPDIGGFGAANYAPATGFGLSNISNLNLPSDLQGATGASNTATGGLLNTVTNGISKSFSSNPLGTLATGIGALGIAGSKPPAYSGASPIENYATTSQFLGPNALTQPTNDQLSSYISTPIEDLAKTFSGQSTRVADAINQSYDNQKQGLVHQFAQAGQNLANSSELQDKVSQLEQKRSTDLSNAALEVQNAGIGQAIQVKQQALSQGMQAGQFNQTLAMQLAGLTGDQQNLQYAIANNDYQGFQQIMGKLLTMGIPQTVNGTTGTGTTINLSAGK